MKLIIVLIAMIVAVVSFPANPHGGDHNRNIPSNAAALPPAGTTPTGQQANGGSGHGDNHGGNKGGGSTTQPPAQTATTAAAATATQAAGQATTTAIAGQNGNTGQGATGGAVDPNLVPDFGQQAGLQPDGTGNCKSNAGVIIPCICPPSRDAFLQKLNQFVSANNIFGLPAPFPTGTSNSDGIIRLNTIISALQNFDGEPGVGCPAASAPGFISARAKLQAAG